MTQIPFKCLDYSNSQIDSKSMDRFLVIYFAKNYQNETHCVLYSLFKIKCLLKKCKYKKNDLLCNCVKGLGSSGLESTRNLVQISQVIRIESV